jgi:hypothetical protein
VGDQEPFDVLVAALLGTDFLLSARSEMTWPVRSTVRVRGVARPV